MGISERTSSIVVWCVLLAGLLLAAADVEAGVTECIRDCQQKYSRALQFECMRGCGNKGNAAAGSAVVSPPKNGAKSGIVADAAGDCVNKNCGQLPNFAATIQCIVDCRRANPQAGAVDMPVLPENGAKSGIVADAYGDCIKKNCENLPAFPATIQCIVDCRRANPQAGAVDMPVLPENGAKSGIVADAYGDCIKKNCENLPVFPATIQCIVDCRRANPQAGAVDMPVLPENVAKSGIVADAYGDCIKKNCENLPVFPATVQCIVNCRRANPQAGAVDMKPQDDGASGNADGAIRQVV